MSASPVFDMVLFGGTGDLAMRKLLPALFQAHQSGTLHPSGRIFALGRGVLSRDAYLDQVRAQSGPHLKADFDAPAWGGFIERIEYAKLDAAHPEDF
ncbi:MAG: glucose-6-phosphate dehydrogenase, partial [Thiomonas sp.]|nr:glucose-6-phosphate dehydrogenase [Thiomonas sp.]